MFPVVSNQGRLTIPCTQQGNSSIITMRHRPRNVVNVFIDGTVASSLASSGPSGAFRPTWSPDGGWIALGLRAWFQERISYNAYIFTVTADGSHYTTSSTNAGVRTYNHEGTKLVYRLKIWRERCARPLDSGRPCLVGDWHVGLPDGGRYVRTDIPAIVIRTAYDYGC